MHDSDIVNIDDGQANDIPHTPLDLPKRDLAVTRGIRGSPPQSLAQGNGSPHLFLQELGRRDGGKLGGH